MASQSFQFVMRTGPNPGKVFDVSKSEIYIGRDINNDIVINDPEVSRHHCRLTQGGGGYTIEDLGSTNGTFVNLTETNTSAVSTLNLGGLNILQNIENLFNNTATVDCANYTINYSTAHAVLRSPVNASSFYGSTTLEWWTNPQASSASRSTSCSKKRCSIFGESRTAA